MPVSTDYDVIVLAGRPAGEDCAGEWLRQQPFPTFSEAFLYALQELGKPAATAEAA
jgi:hypothetical protein